MLARASTAAFEAMVANEGSQNYNYYARWARVDYMKDDYMKDARKLFWQISDGATMEALCTASGASRIYLGRISLHLFTC